MLPFASPLTAPLEVVGVVLAGGGLGAGFAGAWALLVGAEAKEIQDRAVVGSTVGFIVGLVVAFFATLYLLLSSS